MCVYIYIGRTTQHVALSSQTRDHDPVFGVLTTGLPGKSPTSVNEASSLSLTPAGASGSGEQSQL